MAKHISLHSPNGQFGALTVLLGKFGLCIGFVPHLFGIDLVWGPHMVNTANLSEESATFWQAVASIVLYGIVIAELVYLVR